MTNLRRKRIGKGEVLRTTHYHECVTCRQLFRRKNSVCAEAARVWKREPHETGKTYPCMCTDCAMW